MDLQIDQAVERNSKKVIGPKIIEINGAKVIGIIVIVMKKLSQSKSYRSKKVIKLSYARREAPRIFIAKEAISEAYTKVPAKTYVDYIISMSVCLSVAQFCVWLFERTIKASNLRFAARCRLLLPLEVF